MLNANFDMQVGNTRMAIPAQDNSILTDCPGWIGSPNPKIMRHRTVRANEALGEG